jgi:hypothetical protein
MKSTLLNRNLALVLALAALLSELWRGFLDAMFVLPVDFNQPATLQLAAVIFTILFAGWGLALAIAWQGSRRATMATLGINLLVLLAIPISWLFFYCPAECRLQAGVFNMANSVNLILGVLATAALIGQILQPSHELTSSIRKGMNDAN